MLGAIGPVGIHIKDRLPHMRFVPTIFPLTKVEDREGQRLLLKFILEMQGGDKYTDALTEFSCLQGAEQEAGDRLHLHRCLQHTKNDIKAAAARMTIPVRSAFGARSCSR